MMTNGPEPPEILGKDIPDRQREAAVSEGDGRGLLSRGNWQEGSVVDGLYEVQGVLGEGGFGSVHKVLHLGWHMELAVKSPREDKVSSRQAMERFVKEANTWVGLGLHPHIVTCYFVRLIGGIPRIFIEYVQGGTLAEWLLERKIMDAKAAMDIAIQLARAMERSHSRGLVHRDLKPGNCLMTPGGTLKVTDFGLAKTGAGADTPDPGSEGLGPEPEPTVKIAKAKEATITGRLGTPEYMAPEQWYQAGKATGAADAWAFGVVLYELMCGKRPFMMDDGEPPDAFYVRMLESDWACEFRADAPEELKSIVTSCLRHEPRKREARFTVLRSRLEALYASLFKEPYPRELAKETPLLSDALNNQGVSMSDLGKADEALRLFDAALKQDPTHPGAVFNQGVLLLKDGKLGIEELTAKLAACKSIRPKDWAATYLCGLVRVQGRDKQAGVRELKEAETISHNPLIKRALRLADSGHPESALELFVSLPRGAEAAQMEESLFGSLLVRAAKEADSGHARKAYETLMKARGIPGYERAPPALELQQKLGAKGAVKDLRGGWHKLAFEWSQDALCVAVSPDGKTVLSGHADKLVRVWELETGKLLKTLEGHAGPVPACCFLPVKAGALSGSHDGSVRVWDLGTGRCLKTLVGHIGAVNAIAVLPGGKAAMTAGDDGTIKSWDLDQGTQRYSVHAHDGQVRALAVSSDGLRAFTAGADGFVRCWDAEKGNMGKADSGIGTVLSITAPSTTDAFPERGRGARFPALTSWQARPWLLLACEDGRIVKWAVETGELLSIVKGHAGPARIARLTPDGSFFLSSGEDKAVKLWAVGSSGCAWSTEAHQQGVSSACFSPDARYAVTAGKDRLSLWELDWEFEFPERGEQEGKPSPVSPRIVPTGEVSSVLSELNRAWAIFSRDSVRVLSEVVGSLREGSPVALRVVRALVIGTCIVFAMMLARTTRVPVSELPPAGRPPAEHAPPLTAVPAGTALDAAQPRPKPEASVPAEPAELGNPAGPSGPFSTGDAGIEWVSVIGGTFIMGADDLGATPRHSVTVRSFQMAKTEVTNKQYKACVEAGACTPPSAYDGGDDQPVVNIDWGQAKAFSEWVGGRLPSEAEWEYAARSGGKERKFPWGDGEPSCERVVMNQGGLGCGRVASWPVCSKAAGNTEQGLCDMAGNVWEWTQDWHHDSYQGAPTDGSAWEIPEGFVRVDRGGSWSVSVARGFRAAFRNIVHPGYRDIDIGFRPVRERR